jgi:hypothetical protein
LPLLDRRRLATPPQARIAVLDIVTVVGMSPRPGRLERDVPIDLARSRSLEVRENGAFAQYGHQITEVFWARAVLSRSRCDSSSSLRRRPQLAARSGHCREDTAHGKS